MKPEMRLIDTVWFGEYPVPEEVERLGRHLIHISERPRIIRGDE